MHPVLSAPDASVSARTTAADGWQRFTVHGTDALRQLGDRIALDMAAEDYPVKDIARLTRALRELVTEAFAALAARDGWARGVPLRVLVGPAEVRVEAGGPFIDQLHLQKGWELAWNRYRWAGDRLALVTCRQIH